MDYSKINIFTIMEQKLSYHSANQDVLARNVANADTPKYKAQELPDLNFKRLAMQEARRLEVRMTNQKHIKAASPSGTAYRTENMQKTYETTPVKNKVSLEEQMAMVANNKHEYDKTISLYKKTAEMFKTALGTRQ